MLTEMNRLKAIADGNDFGAIRLQISSIIAGEELHKLYSRQSSVFTNLDPKTSKTCTCIRTTISLSIRLLAIEPM